MVESASNAATRDVAAKGKSVSYDDRATLVPAQGEPCAAPLVQQIERANGGVRYKTIDEAAAVLRKGTRWLASWLKAHPVDRYGEPFYHLAGRTKLFTDRDIDRIRENLPCPLPSVRLGRLNHRTMRFAAPTSASLLNEAHALLTRSSLPESKSRSSGKSKQDSLRRKAE